MSIRIVPFVDINLMLFLLPIVTGSKLTLVPELSDKEKGENPPKPPRTHDKPDPLNAVIKGFATVPVLI